MHPQRRENMMYEQERPDPDILLRSIKKEEDTRTKGRLKVFFGMAAGAGKTYAMLEEAHRVRREGKDLVAGYIETHGRSETEALLGDLEIIPRKAVSLGGTAVGECDIDAILARRPEIVLVDELAHTNAQGSRHAKRWQDVIELVDNGISVYTTLNVQHLESQADIVEKIAGVRIRERLPDSVLDRADEIELIDLSPDELRKRLSEGKVYLPEQAEIAAERFFRKGNITALREMALRYTARLVGTNLGSYMASRSIKGPWKTGERLLVAVSPSPYSEYLIRWTRRMADNLKAPWIALYIESQKALTPSAQELLRSNLTLARELGAEVMSTADEDIVSGLIRVAELRNITQIVVGKPLKRYISDYFSGGNLVERLLKRCGDIELHVVTQPAGPVSKRRFRPSFPFMSSYKGYLLAIASIAAVTAANLFLVRFTGYWTIALIYLFAVTLLALRISRAPVLLAAALSAVSWNYLFIPPLHTMRIDKVEDALMFVMYFVIAAVIGGTTSKLKAKETALRVREKRIGDLYELSKTLSSASGVKEIVDAGLAYIEKHFDSRAAIMLSESGEGLSQDISGSRHLAEKDLAVADWVYHNRKPAGLFTQTLPRSGALFLPLVATNRAVGVLAISPVSGTAFQMEVENFLHNACYQIAIRLEHELLSIAAQRSELYRESERLYGVLLNSISHELRTPITAITGSASGLLDDTINADPSTRKELAREISKAGERLNRLVDNLLDMSRIESGMLRLKRKKHDAADLVSVVLRRLENETAERTLRVTVADDLPLISIDFSLMEQCLVNILFNALVYTPADAGIWVDVSRSRDGVSLEIRDDGPGILEADMPHLFEKFKRGTHVRSGGTGLGLSICKGIVEAHGGTITAGNNSRKGAFFRIELAQKSPGEEGL
jgi:two-component system sensor histidine kinase KdpD